MRRQIGLLGTFLLFSLASLAQSYSLQQAQDYASQHSYNLLEGRENVSKAKAQVNETISAGLPQIIGSAAYQNFIRQPVQAIPAEFFGGEPGTFATVVFGTKQNVNLDVTASQLLFDGSYLVGLKAAREVVELSRLQNKLTEQEVRKAVYDAYATAIAAQENYATLSASERNLEKLAEQTKKLREAGLADEISVSQIQINLSNLQNALQNAEIQIGLAKNLLKYTMGLPLDAQITLTSGI
ncbi:MAG: TolC family protein, partial [Luteibaculum sp.]